MSRSMYVVAGLCLALVVTLARLGYRTAAERFHAPQGCVRHREIRYCVARWDRDPWQVNGRAAIGAAAEAWNRAIPYHFREVSCSTSYDLLISFEHGVHAAGHEPEAWTGGILAHASFPGDLPFVHINNDLAWQQAVDTAHRGYDLWTTSLHELGHTLGLEHDLGGDSIMTSYVPRHNPRWSDIEKVRQNARRCEIEPPPPLDVDLPAPGTTWRQGYTYAFAWHSSELDGHVLVEVRHKGRPFWRPWENAAPSGRVEFVVGYNWPPGPYDVCVTHPTAGTVCSSLALVTP